MSDSLVRTVTISELNAGLITPFAIATGRHDSIESYLARIELRDGTIGYGEAAVAAHITGESRALTGRDLRRAARAMAGWNAADTLGCCRRLRSELCLSPTARAGLEIALFDAATRHLRLPLWRLFGERCRLLRTDITVVIGTLEQAEEFARDFYRRGFRQFKIKTGVDHEADIARVVKVHEATRGAAILIDANQGFTPSSTLRFLAALKRRGIVPLVIEQPVPRADLDGMIALTRRSPVPIMADESCRGLADAAALIRRRGAHAINIKLMKTGLVEGFAIARLARAAGLKLMMGAMVETVLALAAAAHLAAGSGLFDFIDLDTQFFVAGNVMRTRILRPNGVLDLSGVRAGLGVTPAKNAGTRRGR